MIVRPRLRVPVFLGAALLLTALMATGVWARVAPHDPDISSAARPASTPHAGMVAGPSDVQNLDTGSFFSTIQDAIDDPATLDGHTLEIQDLVHFAGLITVNKEVTIQGQTGAEELRATTDTGTSGDARAWFLVTVPNVTFKDLILNGQSDLGVVVWQAIRFKEGGAAVSNCEIKNIRSLPSAYNGIGVVGFKNTTVTDCSFSNIGRIGIILFGTDVTAGVVSGCTYTGKGAGDHLDYAVELGAGAVATLTDNTVTDNIGEALSDGSASAGIIVTTFFGPGTTGMLEGNFLNGNTSGVAHGFDAADAATLIAFDNDLSGNDAFAIVTTSATVTADASGNWWGSNVAADVLAETSGSVDWTPWLDVGTDTDGAIGFQGDFSTLHVDDDSPQVGPSTRIQQGVDLVTASTVLVEPGTYEEQVVIEKDLVLTGSGIGVTTILCPPTLTDFFTTSLDNYPVVLVRGATATIEELTVDGAGNGNANFRFVGIGYWSSGGLISNVEIKTIRETPLSGTQHGVGILTDNDTGGPLALEIAGCEVTDFQKNAMALSGAGLTVDVHDCTTVGAGPTTLIAQNGVQVSFGASGSVRNCSISAMDYTPDTFVSSGILAFLHGSLDISGLNGANAITDVQQPVLYQDGSGTMDGVETSGGAEPFGAIFVGNTTTPVAFAERSLPQAAPLDAGLAEGFRGRVGTFAPLTATITNSCLTGADLAGTVGIYAFTTGEAMNVTATNNVVHDWDFGLLADGLATTLTANQNSIASNVSAGYDNSLSTAPQDAEENWWGDVSGPSGDGAGIGDAVSGGGVDFDPWLLDGTNQAAGCGFAPNATVTVASDLNPSTCGAKVNFTATVLPSDATGTVEFFDGASSLGTEALVGGSASISVSTLTAGNHSITAAYSGDGTYSGVASTALIQVVDPIASSTVVTSDINPALPSETITFEAAVSPGDAAGSVEFFDDVTSLGTAPVIAGVATLPVSGLAVGSHPITGVFTSSDGCHDPSTSPIYDQVVATLATTTALSSDLNPSNCGEKVNLTATVSPSTATGTVEFFDKGASLGTAPVAAGVAVLSVTTLPAGHRPLTASYSGDLDHDPSGSDVLIQNNHCVGALTTVVVSPCDSVDWNPANLRPGGSVDLSATYPQNGNGSLEFNTADATSKADWERINGNFNLLSTLSALNVDLYRNSSSTVAAHLAPAVRLLVADGTLSQFSLLIWEPVYNGVPVFPTDAWTSFDLLKQNFWMRAFKPTGGVTIELFDRTLADWLLPGTVFDGGGNESNEVGPNAVVLAYNTGVGSGWTGTFAGAVDNFLIGFSQVDSLFNFEPQLATTVALSATPSKSTWGQKVLLEALISTASGKTPESGTVEFTDQGGTPAYFEGFEAGLGGDPGWDHGAGDFTPTRVASGTNGITSKSGDWHAEAATANGSAFTRWGGYNAVWPTGGYTTQLCIYLDVELAITLSDVRFDWSSAINGSDGNHRRDFVFNAGTDATGFVISAGNNAGRANSFPSNPGHDPVNITETGWYTFKHRFYNDGGVLACDMSIIAPDGTVIVGGPAWTRKDASDAIGLIGGNRYGWFANQEFGVLAFDNATRTEGSLGSAPVVGGLATLSITDLSVGLHDIVATYIPDNTDECFFAGSSAKLPVEVNRGTPTVTVTSDFNPAASGTKVILTATVLPSDATGTVTFCDGADTLGTVAVMAGGIAQLSVTGLANGTHPITGKYSGDGCYEPATSPVYDQVIEDQDAPQVTVISPNGGEVVFPGAPTKISWVADDNKKVASVDICLSRDAGATWEVIVTGLPNTGTYTWVVTPPANNDSPDIVFSSLVEIKAYDNAGNTGTDRSDDLFAIFDLATPTLLSVFNAVPVSTGIELRWHFVTDELFSEVVAQRAEDAVGPWSVVAGEIQVVDGISTLLDRDARPGRTYFYRLAVTAGDQTTTYGPISGTAQEAIRELALSRVSPNPSRGPTLVEFTVPRVALVRISIIDVQGREVAVLAEGSHTPGRYQVQWTGRTERGSAPAGIYFVRLKTAERAVVRRFALNP